MYNEQIIIHFLSQMTRYKLIYARIYCNEQFFWTVNLVLPTVISSEAFISKSTWVNFTNILLEAFMRKDPESVKDTDDFTAFLRFCDLHK